MDLTDDPGKNSLQFDAASVIDLDTEQEKSLCVLVHSHA